MNNKSLHIHERFPEKFNAINQLMAENTNFLALCEDYELCINALRHWANSQESKAKTRFEEYETLARELEVEIQQAFQEISTN